MDFFLGSKTCASMLAAVLSLAAPAKPTHGANYSLTITGGPSNCNETSKAHAGDTATFHYVLRYDASSAVRSASIVSREVGALMLTNACTRRRWLVLDESWLEVDDELRPRRAAR